MSGESPILAGVVPCFEMFMSKWEILAEVNHNLVLWINTGLDWATRYYSRMDNTSAYIISMGMSLAILIIMNVLLEVLNPSIQMSWINKHWEQAC